MILETTLHDHHPVKYFTLYINSIFLNKQNAISCFVFM